MASYTNAFSKLPNATLLLGEVTLHRPIACCYEPSAVLSLSISMLPIRADSASKCGGQPNGSGMDATPR